MGQVRITIVVLFVMIAVVSASLDRKCYEDCIIDCGERRGQAQALCFNRCAKQCQVPAITNAQDICTLSCAKSKCTNFRSDGDVDKAKGCFKTCAEDCDKK